MKPGFESTTKMEPGFRPTDSFARSTKMADAEAERQRRREERDRKRREEEEKWELERKQREEERKQRKLAREASKMRILNEINEIEATAAKDQEEITRETSSENVSEISSPETESRKNPDPVSQNTSPSEEISEKKNVPPLELTSSQEEIGNPVPLSKSSSPRSSPRKLKQLELLQYVIIYLLFKIVM